MTYYSSVACNNVPDWNAEEPEGKPVTWAWETVRMKFHITPEEWKECSNDLTNLFWNSAEATLNDIRDFYPTRTEEQLADDVSYDDAMEELNKAGVKTTPTKDGGVNVNLVFVIGTPSDYLDETLVYMKFEDSTGIKTI